MIYLSQQIPCFYYFESADDSHDDISVDVQGVAVASVVRKVFNARFEKLVTEHCNTGHEILDTIANFSVLDGTSANDTKLYVQEIHS